MDPIKLSTTTRVSAGGQNPNCIDLTKDFKKESNAAFFAEVRKRLDRIGAKDKRFAHGGKGSVGLLGQYGLIGQAVRNAERLIRLDRQPSHWSHAFLFYDAISDDPAVNKNARKSPWIWESTLEPAAVNNGFVERNGVAPRRLSDYDNATFSAFEAHCSPNA